MENLRPERAARTLLGRGCSLGSSPGLGHSSPASGRAVLDAVARSAEERRWVDVVTS
jgi:hypothetical protein